MTAGRRAPTPEPEEVTLKLPRKSVCSGPASGPRGRQARPRGTSVRSCVRVQAERDPVSPPPTPSPRPLTCRREKSAVPGCSTREPQRWHSTAFRFRPSADTSSLGGAAGSMASTPALGGDAQRGLRATSSHCAGAVSAAPAAPLQRRRRFPALDATAQALPVAAAQAAGCRRGFVTGSSWDVTELLPRLTWALGFPYTE